MVFDKTTSMGARMLLDADWHELYFVMPGECLAPWMCPLVPVDNFDKQYIRFLKHTGLENFYWVPIGKCANSLPLHTSNESAERIINDT